MDNFINDDFNKIENKSDEEDLLKYIIKSLISPLEFYNKFKVKGNY